jgi:hypothetical protein
MEPTEHEIDAVFRVAAETPEQALAVMQAIIQHMPHQEASALGMRGVTLGVVIETQRGFVVEHHDISADRFHPN